MVPANSLYSGIWQNFVINWIKEFPLAGGTPTKQENPPMPPFKGGMGEI